MTNQGAIVAKIATGFADWLLPTHGVECGIDVRRETVPEEERRGGDDFRREFPQQLPWILASRRQGRAKWNPTGFCAADKSTSAVNPRGRKGNRRTKSAAPVFPVRLARGDLHREHSAAPMELPVWRSRTSLARRSESNSNPLYAARPPFGSSNDRPPELPRNNGSPPH